MEIDRGKMRPANIGLVAAVLVIGITQSISADSLGTKLTGDQIRQQLVDHTTYGMVSGRSFAQYVASDGTQRIRMANFSDSGTYRITDDGQWCRMWKVSAGGREDCVAVYKNGDTFYSVTPDGSVRASYTAKPGNPEHL